MSSRFVITKADENNPNLQGSVNGEEGQAGGAVESANGTPVRSPAVPASSSPKGSPTSPPAVLQPTPSSPPPTVTFSGVVEDERASIKNSGDVEAAANHRSYGSNVDTALLASPVSEPCDTNDTLENLHLNNGYQDTIDSSMLEDDRRNLYLYAEEIQHRPQITSVIRQLANYQTAIPGEQERAAAKNTPEVAKLGTILGVYLPCIQNIFGVILFIRLVWVVGTAGSLQGFVIVGMSCCTTMLTAISLSAISTNGVVPGGGSYFMISRNLGPEFGGAVGILFYLATTFAAAMYILGAVEIFLMYMTEGAASLFGPVEKEEDKANLLNNMRVMGSLLLVFSGTCVFIGVKFVSRLAPFALVCVLISIVAIYTGIVVNTVRGGAGLMICVLPHPKGERVIPAGKYENESAGFGFDSWCNRNNSLLRSVCETEEDPDSCLAGIQYRDGIPGLNSPVFGQNWASMYRKVGHVLPGIRGDENNEVVSDITTSFALLLGLFFPSCTGIMAGSNRSGDLKDPSKSIPVGTIMAIITTSVVYISSVLLYAGSVEGVLMRDKFGLSVRKKLIIANLAWPNEWVILVGSLLSTVGAGLQSLVGAPRLLQAIAKDGIIPILNPVAGSDKRGEPVKAILVTIAICEFAILVADLDNFVAQLVTMFFLMCYAFVNLACAVQTLLRSPSWRPRFRFYHWILSLFGLLLCFTIMFVSNWIFAILAIVMASIIYKYIEYRGAEKEWGDGIRGLALSAARYSLLRLEQGPPHTKNWRPQLLAFCKLNKELKPKSLNVISFCNQLKAGKGLIVVASVLEGKHVARYAEAQAAKQELLKAMELEKLKGFAEVLVSQDISEGIGALIQTSGLGGLTHNTVIIGWPYGWRQSTEERSWRVFVEGIRSTATAHHALLVLKGLDFPTSKERLRGYIDVWWIVHDGGMLMLLPFLLRQHKTWQKCKMRIFTVAQIEDNSVQIKKDLETFLYHLRIDAEVLVVEMPDAAISAYTYERTLLMEQRNQILKDLKLSNKDLQAQPQCILDHSHPVFSSPSKVRVLLHTVKEEESPSQSGTGSAASGTPAKTPATNPNGETVQNDEMVIAPPDSASSQKTGAELSVESTAPKTEGLSAPIEVNQFTFTPVHQPKSGPVLDNSNPSPYKDGIDPLSERLKAITPNTTNIRRMHDAVRLNEVVVAKSHDAQLVILNMPGPPKNKAGEENYMEFLEVLTEGLERVLLVRGGGREVITIYS